MPDDLRALVTSEAKAAGLDPDFVSRLVTAESNWNPIARSTKGAVGLMQVLPSTAKDYGVTNLSDIRENIKAGIGYLKDLHAKYGDRHDLIAAAYNAGPGAVDQAGGVPHFAETQTYVRKVAGPSAPDVLDVTGKPVTESAPDVLDVKGQPITKQEQRPAPPTSPNVFEQMGPRARGGYNITDEPRSLLGPTNVRGIIGEMANPSPEQQLAMDVLPLVAGAGGTGRSGARATTGVERLRPSLPTGWVPAAKAGVSELASDIPIVRKFGPSLQAAREAYQGARTLEANPPRLVKKASTLTDSLQQALEGAYEQGMRETFHSAPSPSEALPGAAPGGAQAGADTMAMLKARGQPPVVPTGPAATELAAQRELTTPGAQAYLAREGAANQPAFRAEVAAGKFSGGTGPGGIRTVEDISGPLRPLTSGGALTPGEAQTALTNAARSAKMTLTAEETVAARQMVQAGHTPDEVLNALAGLRRLTQGLPSDADVAATVSAKNARTTRAKGGTKIGRFEVVEE